MSLFRPVYLDQRVALSPTEFRDAAADMDAYLLKKIRRRLEERCCTHGYVRRGSTQMLARSMGQAEHCRFTGDFLYHCKVRVLCYMPEAGQTVDAQVLMANKAGAYALLVDQARVTEAMRIFLPRDLHLGNTAFDELQKEQVVRVRLLKSRFKANDPFINAAGVFLGTSSVEVTGGPKKLKSVVAPTEAGGEEDVVEEYETVELPGGGFEIRQVAAAKAAAVPEETAPAAAAKPEEAAPAAEPKVEEAAPAVAAPPEEKAEGKSADEEESESKEE